MLEKCISLTVDANHATDQPEVCQKFSHKFQTTHSFSTALSASIRTILDFELESSTLSPMVCKKDPGTLLVCRTLHGFPSIA